MNWQPSISDDGYKSWHLPATAWSKAEYGEDAIVISVENGEWSARTEMDQCDKRDLDADDIASIRREFQLDRYA